MSPARRTDAMAVAILVCIITLFFVDVLAGYHTFYVRDLTQYYYPAKHALREIVLSGEFPQWNPLFSAGQPMAANPEHEVFYPLNWLILLPGFELGFRLLILVHLYLAAAAMYALLRSMQAAPPAAFFAGLSYAMGGLLLSSIGLLPYLFVLAWLPLTCLFARRFLRDGRPRDLVWAALSLAMQILAGEPSTILQSGLVLALYALFTRRLLRAAMIVIAACLVAAVLIVPSIDHARDSVRSAGFDFAIVTHWSMPLARLAELVHANVFGHHHPNGESLYWGGRLYPNRGVPFAINIYAGLAAAVLAVAGLLIRARGAALFATLSILSVILAAGGHTPLWRLLYDAGMVRSFRYPEKFIAMGVFALIVFAARVLDRVVSGDERARTAAVRVTVAIALVAAIFAAISLTPAHQALFDALWGPQTGDAGRLLALARSGWIVTAARALLLFLLLRNVARARRTLWLALGATFVLLDLGLLVPEVAPRMPAEYLREAPALLRQLPVGAEGGRLIHLAAWQRRERPYRRYFAPQPDLYWIRRNAMLPMIPARWNVPTVLESDYDLTNLRPSAEFVGAARSLSLVRADWLPIVAAMANATHVAVYTDPDAAFARAGGDARRVQPVRVLHLRPSSRYFFAERVERPHDFLRKAAPNVAFADVPPFTPARGRVLRVQQTVHRARIEVECEGRAFLVMSVTPHKYWRVHIDGKPARALVTNIGFQGVIVPAAGRHVIEMRYHNPLLVAGGAISVVSLLALAALAITMRAL